MSPNCFILFSISFLVLYPSIIQSQVLPDWLEYIGDADDKSYYISTEQGPKLDFSQVKYECYKYGLRLATMELEGFNLISEYLSDPPEVASFYTSAQLDDYSYVLRWSSSGEEISASIPRVLDGPRPGESASFWNQCPPLRRICHSDSPPCTTDTRLVFKPRGGYSANCLEERRFICHNETVSSIFDNNSNKL